MIATLDLGSGAARMRGDQTCRSCRFYNSRWGHPPCRRSPPFNHPGSVVGAWPVVRGDGWCGEWRAHAELRHPYREDPSVP